MATELVQVVTASTGTNTTISADVVGGHGLLITWLSQGSSLSPTDPNFSIPATVTSITDSQGNTWIRACGISDDHAYVKSCEIWWCHATNCTGPLLVTIHATPYVGISSRIHLFEVNGMVSISDSGTRNGTGVVPVVAIVTSPFVTTATSDDILVSINSQTNLGSADTTTDSPWVLLATDKDTAYAISGGTIEANFYLNHSWVDGISLGDPYDNTIWTVCIASFGVSSSPTPRDCSGPCPGPPPPIGDPTVNGCSG